MAACPSCRGAPAALLGRALASAGVPHRGLAESRGALGLPDVRQFGDVATLLGDTNRERVWWAGPDSWRVARLLPTGEQDLYGDGPGALVTWDYERTLRRTTLGAQNARLPRADDLLPPQAARRLLGAAGPDDHASALGRRVVAGHATSGLRVVPASPDSTIGAVDVWVEPGSGLPLAVRVSDRAGVTAFESTFLDVDLVAPAARDVAAPSPPGAREEVADAPDLVALADRYARQGLPATVAGRRRAAGAQAALSGTATYGRGLARFVLVPLPSGAADDVLDAARLRTKVQDVPGGQVAVLASGVVSAAVAVGSAGQGAYLVAGLVTPAVLQAAAKGLLTDPGAVEVR